MSDTDVHWKVPWSLGEIGDPRAVTPLLQALERDDPSVRVIAISALGKLNAREALAKLRELLQDDRRSNFGTQTTVAEAARRAIAIITPVP
jgi:HEAT repeat protein